MFAKYIIILLPILCGFAIIGIVLWGDISTDFSKDANAFISIIALSLGHFDIRILEEGDVYLTATFLTCYYFFLIFFLITVFASLMIDLYRIMTMEQGIREGKGEEEFSKWQFSPL